MRFKPFLSVAAGMPGLSSLSEAELQNIRNAMAGTTDREQWAAVAERLWNVDHGLDDVLDYLDQLADDADAPKPHCGVEVAELHRVLLDSVELVRELHDVIKPKDSPDSPAARSASS